MALIAVMTTGLYGLETSPVAAQVPPSLPQTETQRLEQQVQSLRTMLLDQDRLISQLQHELQLLRGDNEVLAFDIQQVKQQQQVIYLDLDTRLRQLSGDNSAANNTHSETVTDLTGLTETDNTSSAPPPVQTPPESSVVASPPPAPPATVPTTPAPSEPSSANLSNMGEVELYQQGFNFVQTEQFNSAITVFKQLLDTYPKGNYADNAQYWIAESHYALRQLDQALVAFTGLLTQYPTSTKRSHALLKIGYTYYEQRNYLSARATLEQVISEYPNSSTARLAQARLQQIQQMGY
ncbi:tol-pal system protein YbgF [Thioflexithrix psekupsensis]|uniref:Cell division coordinator CpoB n=2 Tax=Thioflexithrix psekupsensis TaxID=1570016 RepID=A0A251X7V5_9GAMM|nr:tol-pal system protein YbgF [Thioflexithrix psekupsensis]